MVAIERLTPEQWQRYRAIRLIALQDTPDAFGSTYAQEINLPPARWQARLSPASANFVAAQNGADIGLVTGAAWRDAPTTAGLFSMWVAQPARGQGVADALVQSVVDWAKAAGFQSLTLDVADTNAAAIAFYDRCGFAPTGLRATLPTPRAHITEHQRRLTF